MGASKNIITNLSKDKYTIKAKSTQTISFMGASPNYYRITNGGATPLYLGVSMMPTEDFFDMKIPSACTKLHVDAYGHDEIYIYNPSEFDANIIITSFSAEFEPTVLGLSDIGQDFSSIEMSGEFDATGDLDKNISSIKSSSASTNTNLGMIKSDVDTLKTDVKTIQNTLNTIGASIDLIKGVTKCTKFYIGENTDAENMYTFNHIELLSNDSDSDMNLTLAGSRFVLKPHEVLNKILFDGTKTVKIPKNSSFRIIGG